LLSDAASLNVDEPTPPMAVAPPATAQPASSRWWRLWSEFAFSKSAYWVLGLAFVLAEAPGLVVINHAGILVSEQHRMVWSVGQAGTHTRSHDCHALAVWAPSVILIGVVGCVGRLTLAPLSDFLGVDPPHAPTPAIVAAASAPVASKTDGLEMPLRDCEDEKDGASLAFVCISEGGTAARFPSFVPCSITHHRGCVAWQHLGRLCLVPPVPAAVRLVGLKIRRSFVPRAVFLSISIALMCAAQLSLLLLPAGSDVAIMVAICVAVFGPRTPKQAPCSTEGTSGSNEPLLYVVCCRFGFAAYGNTFAITPTLLSCWFGTTHFGLHFAPLEILLGLVGLALNYAAGYIQDTVHRPALHPPSTSVDWQLWQSIVLLCQLLASVACLTFGIVPLLTACNTLST